MPKQYHLPPFNEAALVMSQTEPAKSGAESSDAANSANATSSTNATDPTAHHHLIRRANCIHLTLISGLLSHFGS
jgi:hypothetical protein